MRTRLRGLPDAAIIAACSSPALGYVADGHEYDLTCNASGYVLKSRYPVSRTVGTRIVSERETIYFGRSCDAYHKFYGYGAWCWANGGFAATFPDHRFAFGRQELFCRSGEDRGFEGSCGC